MTAPPGARVFPDANVLFSAAYRGDSGLLRLWRWGNTKLLTSGFAFEEARRNLDRADAQERLHNLMESVEMVPEAAPPRLSESWGLPGKDVPILAAAVSAGATHLLTGDINHFGHLIGSSVDGVLVLRPADHLKP